MKKYLLASTMAVAIAGFGTSTLAVTEPSGAVHPKDKRLNIEISGQFTPTAWAGSQKFEFVPIGAFGFAQNPVEDRPINKTRGYDFRNYYNRLKVRVYGVADTMDLEYEGHVRFVLNASGRNGDANDVRIDATNDTFIDRLAVMLWGKWGFLEFGDDTSRFFKDNHYSGTIATGIGGWDSYLIAGPGPEYISTVNTITSPFPDQIESNFTKITYKSPAYYGFSLGLTFTPDTGHRGDNPLVEVNNLVNARGDFENVYDVSVEYVEKFFNDRAGVKALVVWQGGKAENQLDDINDVEVFSVSGEISYSMGSPGGDEAGLQIAGDYADFNNTGISAFGVSNGVDAGRVWDVGIAYRTGAWGVFTSYMNTSRNTGTLASSAISSSSASEGSFISPVPVNTSTNQIVNQNGVVVPQVVSQSSIGNPVPWAPSKAKLWAVSAGIEFTLAPGITTFLEFTHVESSDDTSVSILYNDGVNTALADVGREVTAINPEFQDNTGDFVVLGTKITF